MSIRTLSAMPGSHLALAPHSLNRETTEWPVQAPTSPATDWASVQGDRAEIRATTRRLEVVTETLRQLKIPRNRETLDLGALSHSTDPTDTALLALCTQTQETVHRRDHLEAAQCFNYGFGSIIRGAAAVALSAGIDATVGGGAFTSVMLGYGVVELSYICVSNANFEKTRKSAERHLHALEEEQERLSALLRAQELQAQASAAAAAPSPITQSDQTVSIGALTLPRRPDAP